MQYTQSTQNSHPFLGTQKAPPAEPGSLHLAAGGRTPSYDPRRMNSAESAYAVPSAASGGSKGLPSSPALHLTAGGEAQATTREERRVWTGTGSGRGRGRGQGQGLGQGQGQGEGAVDSSRSTLTQCSCEGVARGLIQPGTKGGSTYWPPLSRRGQTQAMIPAGCSGSTWGTPTAPLQGPATYSQQGGAQAVPPWWLGAGKGSTKALPLPEMSILSQQEKPGLQY